jgi:hypothetical protein
LGRYSSETRSGLAPNRLALNKRISVSTLYLETTSVPQKGLIPASKVTSPAWQCMPVIPAFGRLKQEDHEFEVILGYVVRSCLKKKKVGDFTHNMNSLLLSDQFRQY